MKSDRPRAAPRGIPLGLSLLALLAALALSGYGLGQGVEQALAAPDAEPSLRTSSTTLTPHSAAPQRVISLDLCADQYVLRFVPKERIAALSPDADKPFSAMRERAKGVLQVTARGENVLALAPDLVVRAYGGDPQIEAMLARAGVPVVQLGAPQTLAEVGQEVRRVGAALGEAEEAERLADQMQQRLAALTEAAPANPPRILYMTPGGVTAGPGTLVDALIRAAGLRNYQTEPGWQALPLERLAYDRPERVVAASFDGGGGTLDSWSAARHPLAKAQLERADMVPLSGASVACGAWPLVNAVEAMGAESIERGQVTVRAAALRAGPEGAR